MKINVVAQTTNAISSIPSGLLINAPYSETLVNVQRKIRFTADSLMVMDGPFYFNDSTFDMMRIDYKIPLNQTEIWTLVNKTMVAHPFHLHDAQFYLLDRNGQAVQLNERGRKDVVLVAPDDSIRFITKFEDFADDNIPYMFHCHILMHEDDGMMGQFIVSSNALNIKAPKNNLNSSFLIYPNPVSTFITVKSKGNQRLKQVQLFDILGRCVFDQSFDQLSSGKIDLRAFKNGTYYLQLFGEKNYSQRDVIIINSQ